MEVPRKKLVSPFVKESKVAAFESLDRQAQQFYPPMSGWVEIQAYVEPCRGGWKAVGVYEKSGWDKDYTDNIYINLFNRLFK